ncbi:putative transcriptional regulator, PucR family [Catenulispora acidiphila DSM 44928]|uniref:Putative transcriptional regulator, PucR family n=1 Tax=Catenulispora acidiphila (strain DSM 44928 / JCM 14897 / NBRC 102108 / NRRL B-24433 / ID139908) TaxID=479433 RepID=C7QI77_CATAD|nr:PucR family transcriptional regulator [Catenulispora acidiphila]ACU73122.1 putative transcriptional regulator, PucR family [Catenulispora acidiphila DSM 44928]
MRTPADATSRAALGRVLDYLGTTLLDLAAGDPGCAPEVGGVVIHDPLDEPALPPGALVLGVGVRGTEQICELLKRIAADGGVGLIVRAPAEVDEQVRRTVSETGTVLLGLVRGASWTQLTSLLRTLLAEGEVVATEAETIGGVPAGDLFALANAISALLDAPITIEDRSSRVLAFSDRQDEADQSRVETILGRQVPADYARLLEQGGYFRELYRHERPVVIRAEAFGLPTVTKARQAIAVRAGDEILGSIWAAVAEPLAPAREQAFVEAAKLVALHLLRVRAGADVERRLRAELVAIVLEGGPGAPDAAARLGLAGRACVVAAVAAAAAPEGSHAEGARELARFETARQQALDTLAVHLSAVQHGSVAALLGGVVYAVLPVDTADEQAAEQRVSTVLKEYLERTGAGDLVGIGRIARDLHAVPRSRQDADRVLRVLRRRRSRRTLASLSEVYAEALLIDVAAADGHRPSGPVAGLAAYDREHNSSLVATLTAWLDAFGDVNAAAEAVHIHPNTFRYRLHRIAEIGDVDLSDSESRFALMLQLRLLDS